MTGDIHWITHDECLEVLEIDAIVEDVLDYWMPHNEAWLEDFSA